jgi:DNA-directed RNA polymerase subunit RPC12/RpoP
VDTHSKPLIVCPACSSRLIYPLSFEPDAAGRVVVERRCPDCEHSDCVTCAATAVEVWVKRELRIRLEIVRQVLDLEIEAALAGAAAA